MAAAVRVARVAAVVAALAALAPAVAAAQSATAGCVPVPFGQQLDLETLKSLVHTPPEQLLARIERLGIEVRRVPGAASGQPPNPLLVGLPPAEPGLLRCAAFRDEYQGRAIARDGACPGLVRDTVLVRESAPTHTLLHEVAHLLLRPDQPAMSDADVEQRFALALQRLQVYQRRLYDDPSRLLDPRWRRDIVSAQHEVAALLFDRLRIGQSQEAIVERVLADCIDARSPYYDAARLAEGRRYGEAMIDNAIDVFNALNASVEFCDATVERLRAEVAAGRLAEDVDRRLSAEDRRSFAAEQQRVRDAMQRTREAIESLKRFYVR